MANTFSLAKTRFSIMREIRDCLMESDEIIASNIPVTLGDAWVLESYPCIGVLWVEDQNSSLFKGGKADCHISVECWVSTESPDPEEPYTLLESLEGMVLKALGEYSLSNKLSDDINANCSLDISNSHGDGLALKPVYGAKINVVVKWSKLGR